MSSRLSKRVRRVLFGRKLSLKESPTQMCGADRLFAMLHDGVA